MDQRHFWRNQNGLLNPPVWHLPDNRNRFQLFSDIRKTAAGSACTKFKVVLPNKFGMQVKNYQQQWIIQSQSYCVYVLMSVNSNTYCTSFNIDILCEK